MFTEATQGAARVRDQCSPCAITVRKLFATVDPNGHLADFGYGVFDVDGKLVIAARAPLQKLPAVFSANGASAGVVGRIGPGPGEINLPTATAHLAGDTIRIFMPGRSADFSLRSGFVREQPVRSGVLFVDALHLFPSGANVILAAGTGAAAGRDQRPLVVRNADGTVRRRLELLDTKGPFILRILGRAQKHREEQFWVAQSGPFSNKGYSLMLVSTDGRILRSLVHEPSWWLYFAPGPRGERTGPTSKVADVRQRADGSVLVLLTTGRSDWRTTRAPAGAVGFGHQIETRLLLIDPTTAEVVGRATLPVRSANFLTDSTLVTSSENEDGELQLNVFGFRIQ